MMRNAEMFPSLFTSLRSRSCAKPALPSRSCPPGLCVPGCPPASRLTVGQRVQCRQSHLTRSRARRPFGAGPVFTEPPPSLCAPRPQRTPSSASWGPRSCLLAGFVSATVSGSPQPRPLPPFPAALWVVRSSLLQMWTSHWRVAMSRVS